MAGWVIAGGVVAVAIAARKLSFKMADAILPHGQQKLSGHNVLITGASTGIGLETASVLAQAGANVYLACRDQAKAEKAIESIRRRYSEQKLNLILLPLDLNDFRSIHTCAQKFLQFNVPLHTLILNAGTMPLSRKATVDGIDPTFQANHFGHFALTKFLMDKLRESKTESRPSRVVVLSSSSHAHSRVENHTLPLEKLWSAKTDEWNFYQVYSHTKLANVQYVKEFHRRYGSEVDIFAVHPGDMIGTEIGRNFKGGWIFMQAFRLITPSVNQGAATSVYCTVEPTLSGKGGGYYVNCGEKKCSKNALDETANRRLWDESEQHFERLLAKVPSSSSATTTEKSTSTMRGSL